MIRRLALCLGAAFFAGSLWADDLAEIQAFHEVDARIATAGTLRVEDLDTLASEGFEVVIDLRALGDGDPEPAAVQSRGMQYVNVPVSSSNPTAESLDAFLAAMRTHRDSKVLVHCRSNSRSSKMTYLYQVLEEGADPVQAMQHVTAVRAPSETWQAFMDAALQSRATEDSDSKE